MCGIVAYRGERAAAPLVFRALARLEYRGYDSAGIAVRTPGGRVEAEHTVQGVTSLASVIVRPDVEAGRAAIGHTRWATHGEVTERNAHPLRDCTGSVYVAHNGIIENADDLRSELIAAGHHFTSGVDSEVIAHLVEDAIDRGVALSRALERAASRLSGTWAIVAVDAAHGRIAATTNGSPLIVAQTSHGTFVSSDVNAVSDLVESYQVVGDGDVVDLGRTHARWRRGGRDASGPRELTIRWRASAHAEGTHDDHMGNEIDEQPAVASRVVDTVSDRIEDGALWRSLGLPSLREIERVVILGCGTSLNAGRAIGNVLTHLGRIPTTALIASEAASHVFEPRTFVLAISQSGETADILRALDAIPRSDRTLLALTNDPSSSLARRADAVIDCVAGPEIGVAATKTFVAQVMMGVAVVLSGLAESERADRTGIDLAVAALRRTPVSLAEALSRWTPEVATLTDEFAASSGFLFLGVGTGLVYAAEGALKLKELSYRWAEDQPAGELKHGPLALIEPGTPVFVVDSGEPRIEVAISEVTSRGGRVVRIGDPELRHERIPGFLAGEPPWGPLDSVVPLQLFARSLALRLGRNVDKPRNLAKSVTVQ